MRTTWRSVALVVVLVSPLACGESGGGGDAAGDVSPGAVAVATVPTTAPAAPTTIATSRCERATARFLGDENDGRRSLRDCPTLAVWRAAVNVAANPRFERADVIDAVAVLCQAAEAGFGEIAICDEVALEVAPAPVATVPPRAPAAPVTPPPPPAPVSHEVTGAMYLFSAPHSVDGRWRVGQACYGEDGYHDIGPGTQVTARDGSNMIIGTSSLGPGRVEAWPAVGPRAKRCVFPFTLSTLPDAAFYGFEVSHRGEIRFSRAEMERNGWRVEVHLG